MDSLTDAHRAAPFQSTAALLSWLCLPTPPFPFYPHFVGFLPQVHVQPPKLASGATRVATSSRLSAHLK